jgi:UDP-N-acetylglucosamine--N-acetylmuramyl-(pentapeptide) pyrophosphoryl-undecaprenol N-acetylglucosamine transferase
MKRTIIFTGGGSGGHVMPALTLINKLLLEENNSIHYIGGRKSIESELTKDLDVKYFPIFTGKLRRYISIENIIDIFKVMLGTLQSILIMLRFNKNTLVFSTGGFVSVPVVVAAKLTGKRIYIHEQTTRVGLANKICSKLADKVFVSFEESLQYFPKDKVEWSGYPLRDECYTDKLMRTKIRDIDVSSNEKPIMFITGGGNGSLLINESIKKNLDDLKSRFVIFHQVGKNFLSEYKEYEDENYKCFDFVGDEMIDLFKASSIVISRAGAGTVCELMAINKASIYIPLKIAQKNEQYHNAMAANESCGAYVFEESQLEEHGLKYAIDQFEKESNRSNSKQQFPNGTDFLLNKISTL